MIALAEEVSPATAAMLRKERETTKRRQRYANRIDSLLARMQALTV